MASTFPTRDTELLPWTQNFSSRITATPIPLGFTAAEATILAGLFTAFSTALAAALNPVTRTKSSVTAKETAKAQMMVVVRSYAKRIQANPNVTASQKTDLGLKIQSTSKSPKPKPTTEPTLNILSSGTRSHNIRLADILTPDKRARPEGVAGAEVYSFVPAMPEQQPPTNLEQWRFEGLATKADFEVDYEGADVGKTATIVARWYNTKGETGPVSQPVSKLVA